MEVINRYKQSKIHVFKIVLFITVTQLYWLCLAHILYLIRIHILEVKYFASNSSKVNSGNRTQLQFAYMHHAEVTLLFSLNLFILA